FEDGVYFTEQRLQPIIDQQASQLNQKDVQLNQQAKQIAELEKYKAYMKEHGLKLPSEDLQG
ncbi:MAG: hypothetical protein MJZ50_08865, partial [Treponema sp.]|nr:hypothetical protein [Treponema sp.]